MNSQSCDVDAWRKPNIGEATELFSEPGRVLGPDGHKVDYGSHWFVLTIGEMGGYTLFVKHGGGQERINLSYRMKAIVPGWASMTSDQRFLMFWELMEIQRKAGVEGRESESAKYRAAFVDGRLKKRKLPAQGRIRVWIETVVA